MPQEFGSSGGGGTGDYVATGGGILQIITREMIHDGQIMAVSYTHLTLPTIYSV